MLPYVLTSQMTPEKGIQHINRHKGWLSRQMVLESWIFTYRRWKLDFFIFNYKNNLKVGYRVKLKTWNCETTRGNISKHSRQVPLNTGNKRKQSNVSPSNWAASLQRAPPPIKTKERTSINTHLQKDLFLPCKQKQSIQIDFWRILDGQASHLWSNA